MNDLFFGIADQFAASPGKKDELLRKCSNAGVLNDNIMTFSEWELRAAMFAEKNDRNRFNILSRLYSRYTKVRTEREKKEIYS